MIVLSTNKRAEQRKIENIVHSGKYYIIKTFQGDRYV